MLEFSELQQKLLNTTYRVVIVSHRSPDGDSVGSSLGMAALLKHLGHQVQVITPDPAPAFLDWMPGFEEVINFDKQREQTETAIAEAELICCLDFNTLMRSASLEQPIRANKTAILINLDHHQNPDDFAHYQWSDTKASSTAEIVYQFAEKLLDKPFENADFAQCIYTGILTDTGSFRFSATTPLTHAITANLLAWGADPTFIHSKIYDSYSADRLKLLGFALHEKLLLIPAQRTAIIALTEAELQSFRFQRGDTEGLVNFPLSIKEVNLSILITEKDGKVKMSFRSKGDFPANELAGEHFNGGGHINAAGGISKVSVAETVEKLTALLPNYEAQLDY